MTPQELEPVLALLREHYGTPCHKVLTCAQDVCDALAAASAHVPARRHSWEFLFGVAVIVSPDSPPGTWKMTRHDHCDVTGGEREEDAVMVTHRDCTILGRSGR